MDWPELGYRIGKFAHARMEHAGIGRASPGEPVGDCGQAWCTALAKGLDVATYVAAADQVMAGRFDVFAMRGAALGFPPAWNTDPKTGTPVPLKFGKTLNYRDERVVGDIKYLWEPNRHLELVTLAQAWHLTGNRKYADACKQLVESWLDQCPYMLGVNWTSSLEHAVRLLNWSFAWHLLGGDGSPLFQGPAGLAFRRRWLHSVHQHCHFIAGHFSRYSSANNHLLGEYMGLLVGSLTWPLWPESAAWRSIGKAGFETEALRQNGPDGVNREQAIYYHHEVMDMMLICGLICRRNGIEFQSAYWRQLEALAEFLVAAMDRAGNVPMIGDADDALMVRLSQEPGWTPFRSLLATCAVLFRRGDFASKASQFDEKSRWLLGDNAAIEFANLPLPTAELPKRAFAEGGYYLLGARFGAVDEVRALVDCGPIGYLSIAAHGHADALSMVLSAGGHELLIDPGTFAYHTQPKWRNYFRGTFAHNTVRLDQLDQSVIGGNFLWLRKAKARCDTSDLDGERQLFKGTHDGYQRLADPVTHEREIAFDAISNCFSVTDTLHCLSRHQVEVCWHFAEACQVTCGDGRIVATVGNCRLTMRMTNVDWEPTVLHGQESPPAGWISRSFDKKTPTASVVWKGQCVGKTQLRTEIALSFDGRSDSIERNGG